jgi:hypothetical protein
MLVLQLPPATATISRPVTFPCKTTIQAKLEPREVFDGAPRTGRLHMHLPGARAEATVDPVTTDLRIQSPGAFSKLSFDTTVLGYSIGVRGGTVTVECECADEREFTNAVEFVYIALPGILAAAVPAPVYVHTIDGAVGNVPFEVTFPGVREVSVYVTAGDDISRAMAARLESFSKLRGNVLRVTAAHRYLMQVRRLAYVSFGSNYFVGERILNLAKTLEVLFGDGVDPMRVELRKLGIDERVVELLASVHYVRDEIDVGHPAMGTLQRDDYDRVLRFADNAERAVTGLLHRLTTEMGEGRYVLPLSAKPVEARPRQSKTISALAKHDDFYVMPFGPTGSLKPLAGKKG